MPYGPQLPLQKGLHLRVHDPRGSDAKDDEPLHPPGPAALGTLEIMLIGRRARPEY